VTVRVLAALVLFCACAAPPVQHEVSRARPALFEFHSDPWVNLHQRLLAEAQGDANWHVPVVQCPCAASLPAWESAVAGYRAKFQDRDPTFDRALARANLALAMARPRHPAAEEVWPLLSPVFERYSQVSWPEDDAKNRAWIDAARPLVARWGPEIAAELAKRYETTWPSAPIRVEVSRFAGWAGAYTTFSPILVTMSSEDPGYQGPAALEMLFHEASHGLTQILVHDLDMAFVVRGKTPPRALDHVIIFYTAGEIVRRKLGPSHVPYAYKNGVYARGWSDLEKVVAVHWRAWLDDAIDLHTALGRLADAL
jgi:hypothetical protein